MTRLINIDNGGTLTDICVIDGDDVRYTKTLTTPFDLEQLPVRRTYEGVRAFCTERTSSPPCSRPPTTSDTRRPRARTPSSSAKVHGLGLLVADPSLYDRLADVPSRAGNCWRRWSAIAVPSSRLTPTTRRCQASSSVK